MYRRVPSVTPSGHVVKVGLSLPSVPSFVPSIAIPRLSEVLSELVWRIVGGTVSVDLAIDYLASDKPFQHRLGPRGEEGSEGDEEGKENKQGEKGEEGGKEGEEKTAAEPSPSPLLEALCDTIWGVDAMASHSHIPMDVHVCRLLGSQAHARSSTEAQSNRFSMCRTSRGPRETAVGDDLSHSFQVFIVECTFFRPGLAGTPNTLIPTRVGLHVSICRSTNMSFFSFYHVEASKW